VRTDPKEGGYRGLSMLLAEKPRGSDAEIQAQVIARRLLDGGN
jgi:hypothetical protein